MAGRLAGANFMDTGFLFKGSAARPSIDAPVALFFGTGTLYNRDQREYLVKGFPIHIRDDGVCYPK